MVRIASFPQDSRKRPDPIRIAAISASIAANLALFAFLMQPMAYSPPTDKPDTSDFKLVDLVKPKPKLLEIKPPEPKPHPQVVHVLQKPQVIRPVDPIKVITTESRPIDLPMVKPQPLIPPTGDNDNLRPPPVTISTTLSPIASPAPDYPIDAVRDEVTGTVQLELLVGVDGRVVEARVVRSSGDRRLDAAARDQVLRNWRFAPVLQNGVAVQALGRLPVVFTLNGQ